MLRALKEVLWLEVKPLRLEAPDGNDLRRALVIKTKELLLSRATVVQHLFSR